MPQTYTHFHTQSDGGSRIGRSKGPTNAGANFSGNGLERLRAEGPLSVNELARRLQRDYKNVHGDVKRLAELGLIERRKDALVSVAWDVVQAEVCLAA